MQYLVACCSLNKIISNHIKFIDFLEFIEIIQKGKKCHKNVTKIVGNVVIVSYLSPNSYLYASQFSYEFKYVHSFVYILFYLTVRSTFCNKKNNTHYQEL